MRAGAERPAVKGWRIAMLALAAAMVAVVVVTFAVIKPMVTRMVVDQANEMGFRNVNIDIDHLGPTRVHIASLTLGPGRALGARDITILFSPFRVLGGQLDEVRIGDLFIAASLKPGDPMLPFLEGYHSNSGEIVLPVDRIDIAKSSLNIVSPAGDYELGFTGTVLGVAGGGATLNGSFKLAGGAGEADGTLKGKMDGAGNFDGSAQVAAVTFMAGALNIASGQAEITARGDLNGLEEANAQFAFLNSRLAGVALETLDGEANYRPAATRLDLTLNSGNPKLSGTASVEVDTDNGAGPTKLAINANLAADGFAGLEPLLGQPAELSGNADLRLDGTVEDASEISDDLSSQIIPRALLMRGRLLLKSGQLQLLKSGLDTAAGGSLDISLDEGRLTLNSDEGITVAARNWGSVHVTGIEGGRRPLGVDGAQNSACRIATCGGSGARQQGVRQGERDA